MPLETHLYKIVLKYKIDLIDFLPGRVFYVCLQHKDPVLSYLWRDVEQATVGQDHQHRSLNTISGSTGKTSATAYYNHNASINEILVNRLLQGTDDHYVLFYKTLQVQNHDMLITLGKTLENEAKLASQKITNIFKNQTKPDIKGTVK